MSLQLSAASWTSNLTTFFLFISLEVTTISNRKPKLPKLSGGVKRSVKAVLAADETIPEDRPLPLTKGTKGEAITFQIIDSFTRSPAGTAAVPISNPIKLGFEKYRVAYIDEGWFRACYAPVVADPALYYSARLQGELSGIRFTKNQTTIIPDSEYNPAKQIFPSFPERNFIHPSEDWHKFTPLKPIIVRYDDNLTFDRYNATAISVHYGIILNCHYEELPR